MRTILCNILDWWKLAISMYTCNALHIYMELKRPKKSLLTPSPSELWNLAALLLALQAAQRQ